MAVAAKRLKVESIFVEVVVYRDKTNNSYFSFSGQLSEISVLNGKLYNQNLTLLKSIESLTNLEQSNRTTRQNSYIFGFTYQIPFSGHNYLWQAELT